MKCGIVTPIGPGHSEAYGSCKLSIQFATERGMGPFSSVELFPIDDQRAQLGRSRARNLGVKQAEDAGCDWIFFLDADDLMFEDAFENVNELINEYDAIWGLICEAPFNDFAAAKIRERQLRKIHSIEDILNVDPFLTLQMGVFIKTKIALANPFDEEMDTGEDFKFYLACWKKYKCIKTDRIFFVNIRGNHSTGPRSADGRMWRIAVEKQQKSFRK